MVSVALAVYNGEKYLKEQVESILSQTYSDIELVMTDDNSSDGSWKVMNAMAAGDSRIRIYHNERNLGFQRNFQKAISLCRGEFVALSDQDDIWMDDHLKLLMDNIGDKPLACGNNIFMDGNGKLLGETLKWQESLDWIPEDSMKVFRSIILFRNPFQGATMLLRRSFLDLAMPIPDDAPYHDTWFASLACFCGGISYVDKPLLKYRRTSNSITGLRIKRKSKLYKFLFVHFFDDRKLILNSIEKRLSGRLSRYQEDTISTIRDVLERYYNKKGMWKVHLYELLHYKSIFSCDLTHWI